MSLATTSNKVQYAGNGILTNFGIPFIFKAQGDIQIFVKTVGAGTVQLNLGADYTLSGVGNPLGGSATLAVAPANGTIVTIVRVVSEVQSTSYTPNAAFPSAAHEAALDYLTMQVQQLQEIVSRCIQVPVGDTAGATVTLPASETRANLALKFDANGNVIAA